VKPIQDEILPRGLLIAYGLPSLPLALLAIPFVIYLPPFYGSDLKLGLAPWVRPCCWHGCGTWPPIPSSAF